MKKIIVAVRGIGDQAENETILSTVKPFCTYYEKPHEFSLGTFHGALDRGRIFEFSYNVPQKPKERIGFVEVYWANIPRRLVRRGYILQETKAWAKTLVDRIAAQAGKDKAEAPLWKKWLTTVKSTLSG